ncbi:hypothetical protein ZTR_10999 [Talaromyces verruculosus]|nr:hypothetical protein ZTR_10999 [Talaromyces verruculosus]
MKVFATLAVLATIANAEIGYWKLYCGDSCSTGTLINQGDIETNVTTTCTSLGATYDYCYLEVDESYPNVYRSVLSADTTCGRSTNPVLSGGECTSAGSWEYYEIYYYL